MTMTSFTAMNGADSPKAANANGNSTGAKRAGSSERTRGPAQDSDKAPKQQPSSDANISHRERDDWAPGSPGHDREPSPAKYADMERPHKRKRSSSTKSPRTLAQTERQQEDVRLKRAQESEPRERDPYERDARGRRYRSYGDDGRDRGREAERERDRDSWYFPHERRHEQGPCSCPPSPDSANTEEQIGDAPRRVTEDYPQTSPDGDDISKSYPGQYTPEQRRNGVVHSDPKKRKRNFNNRTKTGCLTCRKRKKKCDEARPECSNCLRGGFVCAGYPLQRETCPKPENKVQTIHIESKDPNYVPPGAYGMPQPAMFPRQQGNRESLPSYRGQPLLIEPPQGRLVFTDDDRLTASTLPTDSVMNPNEKLSAFSSAYPNNPADAFMTLVSLSQVPFPERAPKEYQRLPPLHELTRTESGLTEQRTTLPHINTVHATRTNNPIATSQSGTNPQVTAHLALSHTLQFRSPIVPPATAADGAAGRAASSGGPGSSISSNSVRLEKNEMIAGRPFYPFERELVLERERCSAACWRFNNSTHPKKGVSPAERARLFREILVPRDPIQLTPAQSSPVTHTGRVGENVAVEAPFTCDYGYNISIGKNTVVGRNCTVLDACELTIGNNVVIGPNVNFYTTTTTTDPQRRNGARGPCTGKSITIEDDVFIGGSVTILGGVRIGRGTTVGAWSLVTQSLPSHVIVAGHPAKVMRGIASMYP
ncbi:bacterial transferase hexapeptide [Diaporthe sp. PMI_573]|nr:bacterial transferase hexapeptide [Diaporthaceae sp. PMI_573]